MCEKTLMAYEMYENRHRREPLFFASVCGLQRVF